MLIYSEEDAKLQLVDFQRFMGVWDG